MSRLFYFSPSKMSHMLFCYLSLMLFINWICCKKSALCASFCFFLVINTTLLPLFPLIFLSTSFTTFLAPLSFLKPNTHRETYSISVSVLFLVCVIWIGIVHCLIVQDSERASEQAIPVNWMNDKRVMMKCAFKAYTNIHTHTSKQTNKQTFI